MLFVTMVTLIIYDIKADTEYSKLKRKFYYGLKPLVKEGVIKYLNKSVIIVAKRGMGSYVRSYIEAFKPHISAYIISARSIEEI